MAAVGWWIRTSIGKLERKIEHLEVKIGALTVSAAERTSAERSLETRLEAMQHIVSRQDDDIRTIQLRCAAFHETSAPMPYAVAKRNTGNGEQK
jgi:hypothetical protein